MKNKFSGKCSTCGATVLAGAGTVTRNGRRWTVHCAAHSDPHATDGDRSRVLCPDCHQNYLTPYQVRHHYHCDACTRAIEGPAYFEHDYSASEPEYY